MTASTSAPRVRLRQHSRAIRALLAGSLVSLVGTEVFEVVVLMLTTAAYGAILSTGALGVAMRLAPMVLSPLITAFLDRSPARRPRFARSTVIARAVAIGLFAVFLALESAPTWAAYALIAVIAALDASYLSAVRATMPQLIEDSAHRDAHLSDAASRLVAQWNGVQILVPPAVFVVLELLDVPIVMAAAAGLLLVAFAILGDPVRRSAAAQWPATGRTTVLQRLTSGFRTVAREPVARSVTVLGAVSGGTLFTFSLTIPVVVATGQAPDVTVGLALAAMAAGSLLGARWAARFTTRSGRQNAMLSAAALQAVVLALLAAATAPPLVGVALVVGGLLLGVSAGVGAVGRSTLLQSEFDASVLGSLMVTVAVLGQVLMPVLPGVWEYAAAQGDRLPAAFLLLVGVQVAGIVVASADIGRARRRGVPTSAGPAAEGDVP